MFTFVIIGAKAFTFFDMKNLIFFMFINKNHNK